MLNLFRLSAIILFAQLAFGQVPTAKQDQYNRFKSVIVNGGFENGTAQWSASGGSFTASTTSGDFRSGLRGGVFDASAASQTLTSAANTMSAGNNQVSCWFKTAATDYTFSAYNGSADLVSQVIPASSVFQKVVLNVALSSAGTLRARVTSGSNAAALYIDDCFSGEADNVGNGNFASDWAAYTPTYTGFGTVGTSNMFWRRVGDNIELSGSFVLGTSTATEARVSFPAGLTSSGTEKIANLSVAGNFGLDTSGATVYRVALMEPSVTYITFGLGVGANPELSKAQGSGIASSGTKLSIKASVPIQGWNAQSIFNPATQFTFAAAKSPNGTFTTASASMVDVSDASYTTNRVIYGTAEAPSTANFFGVRVRNLPAGTYKVQGYGMVMHATANQSCYIQFSDGTNVSGFESIPINGTAARNSINSYAGYFTYTSPQADLTFRLQARTSSGTCSFGALDTGNEQSMIEVTPMGPQVNAPILIGGVTSGSTGAEKIERAKLNCDASSSIISQSGSWVSSIGNRSTTTCSVTLASGFSAAPTCNFTINAATVNATSVQVTSSTAVSIYGPNADYDGDLICVGPR